MSIVLKKCRFVITPRSLNEVEVREDVDVVIEDGVIQCVDEGCSHASGTDKIDCSRYVAIPAFGNAHTHAAMVALRGYADDYELFDWLAYVWRAEKLLTEEIVYNATLIGCIEMVMNGVGAFQDMYFYPCKVIEAAMRIGLRVRAGPIAGMDDLRDLRKWIELAKKSNGMYIPIVNVHSLYSLEEDIIVEAFESAERHGLDVHIHLSETRREIYIVKQRYGLLPVEYLARRGFLSPRVVAVHLNWITSWEIDLLAQNGVKAVVNPTSGAKLAVGGFAPLREMLSRGITVGLGTDGACSSNKLSILREMRFLVLLYRHNYWDTWIRAQHAFSMATLGSYKVMGFRGGAIAPGHEGDIVLIDLRSLRMYPPTRNRVLSHIVYSAESPDIAYTIIKGRIVWSQERAEELYKVFIHARKVVDDYVEKVEELRESSIEPPWRA